MQSIRNGAARRRAWRFPPAAALALAPALLPWGLPWGTPAAELAEQRIVDLELVLAVDAASSVSAEEFELQVRGLATDKRTPLA